MATIRPLSMNIEKTGIDSIGYERLTVPEGVVKVLAVLIQACANKSGFDEPWMTISFSIRANGRGDFLFTIDATTGRTRYNSLSMSFSTGAGPDPTFGGEASPNQWKCTSWGMSSRESAVLDEKGALKFAAHYYGGPPALHIEDEAIEAAVIEVTEGLRVFAEETANQAALDRKERARNRRLS